MLKSSILDNVVTWLLPFVAGLLGALMVNLFTEWQRPPIPKIVTVNITKLTQDFIKQEQANALSNEVIKRDAATFGSNLDVTLKNLSTLHGFIILPSEAIMAGAIDETAYVKNEMSAMGVTNGVSK